MPGAGWGQLELDPLWDPALEPSFESVTRCLRLDREAASTLQRQGRRATDRMRGQELLGLGHRLDYQAREEEALLSRACRLFAREERRIAGSNIAALINRTQRACIPVSMFTLIGRDSDVTAEELADVDPYLMARRLSLTLDRLQLNRRLRGSGWAVAFLDCEYQQAEGVFRLHWHGFACGEQLRVIDALRTTRNYRSPRTKPGEERSPVRHRVHLTRQPLQDLRLVCIYPLKPEWQMRTVPSNQEGNRERSWPRPLPRRLLGVERQFFDRWSLQDLSMTRGLRVVGRRLHETRPES